MEAVVKGNMFSVMKLLKPLIYQHTKWFKGRKGNAYRGEFTMLIGRFSMLPFGKYYPCPMVIMDEVN